MNEIQGLDQYSINNPLVPIVERAKVPLEKIEKIRTATDRVSKSKPRGLGLVTSIGKILSQIENGAKAAAEFLQYVHEFLVTHEQRALSGEITQKINTISTLSGDLRKSLGTFNDFLSSDSRIDEFRSLASKRIPKRHTDRIVSNMIAAIQESGVLGVSVSAFAATIHALMIQVLEASIQQKMKKRPFVNIFELKEKADAAVARIHREAELNWLSDHPELLRTCAGKWIAINGKKLISVDEDLSKVAAKAHSVGISNPFVLFIPKNPDENLLGMSNQSV